MKAGSLCSGYGGLDMAAGYPVAWHAEVDPAAVKVLAHRWPGVPNHGDITSIDWPQVEPVDVLTAGFPCQDVSLAGARKGLRSGTRSGLWAHVARAINHLRPPLVFLENVRGLLSAGADSDMEPCPWCLGDAGDQHALRALGAVLGDLADLGYDASWCGLRAADVGAPHGRYRVFVAAWPTADPVSLRRDWWAREPWRGAVFGVAASGRGEVTPADTHGSAGRRLKSGSVAPGPAEGTLLKAGRRIGRGSGSSASHADDTGREGTEPASGPVVSARGAAANSPSVGRGEGRTEPARIVGRPDAPVGRYAATSHAHLDELPRERVQQPGGAAAAWRGGLASPGADSGGLGPGLTELRTGEPDVDWGAYAPAIHRWETVLGRAAPAPTIRGTRGKPKLSPYFVEWMQGLDVGHVTAVPELSTNDMLRLLGNGVVPRQGAAAWSWLLRSRGVAA